MNKKANSSLSSLGELILAAIILFVILVPTYYLINWYSGGDECDNKAVFNDLYTLIQDLESKKVQSADLTGLFNQECFITTFSQDQSYNQIKPPKNEFKSPFICLCKIDNDECAVDNQQSCVELKTFSQINDAQFTTNGLDTYVSFNFKREDKKLVISEPISVQKQPEENQIQPLDTNKLLTAMDYAKINTIENRKCYCDDKCQEYANLIIKFSNEKSIDPLLTLSVIMQESQCKQGALSNVGCAGLMQICSWGMCKSELNLNGLNDLKGQQNAEKNIECGTIILKKYYDQYKSGKVFNCGEKPFYNEWEAALRGYVGWGCDSQHKYYVEEVMKRYSQLKNPPQPLIVAQK